MKTVLYFFIFISVTAFSIQFAVSDQFEYKEDFKIINYLSGNDPCSYLSQPDAEKIMGKPVVLSETSSTTQDEVLKQRCIYSAVSPADKDVNENLNIGVDEYKDEASAKKVFSETVSDNEKDAELKDLNIGDESYLQSTPGIFHMIMIRKGNKILLMKINRVSDLTSLDEMLGIAERITLSF